MCRTGFENVMQTDENWIEIPNGFSSGDPARSGSFTQLFDQPGTFYFRSYVHTELRTTVTVMPCKMCSTIMGYQGADPVSAAVALSSRTPGSYTLDLVGHALMGLITVYAGQTFTCTGSGAPIGQLALLDASIHVQPGGVAVLNTVP